ncbi:MAG: LLM class flavin-dependent oxidoreductase [Thaumarchaeota archaeon]|nr:LLM class flavin-dependent oxidoreductase [Nitrososphaerota archaeon]
MPRVQFGARIPASGPASSVPRVIDATRDAEALGYDTVFDMDHIHNSHQRHQQYPVGMGYHKDPSNTLEPNQFETISMFSFLAGITKKVNFGVGVMPIPLRDPIILAKEIGTMEALSGGRFIFGVGVSNVSDKPEYKATGRPFLSYAERYEMLTEYIAAMKEIWAKPSATFHGKYVKFEDLVIYPKPPKGTVPVWIGCETLAGERERPAVKFALEHADGWIMGFLMNPETMRSMVQDFKATAKQAGKNLSKFDWCFQLRLSIGETEKEARTYCDWIAGAQQEAWRYWGLMYKQKEAPVSAVKTASVGTPSKIISDVEKFIEAGTTHFDLWFMYPRYENLLTQMRLFAKEVIPSFST